MCGIAGIVDPEAPRRHEALLKTMLGLIRHRGPDAFGIFMDGRVGLASSRLRIIDLAGGDQPIRNEDGTVWVVYNGEIFNYPELRIELEKAGHRFYTQSDTEVIVHLYEELGHDLFSRLNGQFALAIWDCKTEKLTLARDRLGIRPLFYFCDGEKIIFASEIKAVIADPRVPRSMDLETLSDIFTCWSPLAGKTIFKDIMQLEPGHYAEYSCRGLMIRPYWRISFSCGGQDEMSGGDWIEALDSLIRDAVRIRLRADVPVGAYLSGGLDSTFLTSVVKKHFNNRLCTFSVGFSDGRFDERDYQKKAVSALGTEHRALECREEDIGRAFPDVVWHSEQPILRTAPAPLFLLSDLVHQNRFKVVLTGEGADEIFAGYDIFKEDKICRFWARSPESPLRPRILQRIYPDIFAGGGTRTARYLEEFFRKGLQETESAFYSHRIRWANTSALKTFFSDDLKGHLSGLEPFEERCRALLPADFMSWDPLARAQYTEISLFLSNYLLSAQGDRMAMAHSVEGRFPFLDYRVVEFAGTIPARLKLSGLCEKYILRKTASRYLPAELAERPKQPYRAPISRCFFGRSDTASEWLSETCLRNSGLFDAGKVGRLVEKCRRQQGFLASERENMALVGVISTEILARRFLHEFSAQRIEIPENIRIYRRNGQKAGLVAEV